MRVLVAPDSFKGTFSAAQVAAAIGAGIETAGDRAVQCPLADGGEGTMAVLAAARGGDERTATVADPLGRPVSAAFALIDQGQIAVVETAAASGLHHVRPSPEAALAASTAGTGELLVAAARSGARDILLGLGGSATTDGGAGAIAAIAAGGGLGDVQLELLCDVVTPYEDAAAVFAPQKGADAAAVGKLTARLHAQASILLRDPRGVPMTGAAGGLSGALWASCGGRLVGGASRILDLVGFDGLLATVDAVVTGEGRLDAQTGEGKLVGEVVRRSRERRVPVHAVVGSLDAAGVDQTSFASVTVASTRDELLRAWPALRAGAARA
ncbi:MAG: glycerate 2-kinase [Solirubrobacteraceae bacterium]|nr:glycerate 2-kinase [Solirubrobacteraceae bacterium]